MKYSNFLEELSDTESLVTQYINNDVSSLKRIQPAILEECVLSYVKRGGKKLRPAVLTLSCMAVGGQKAVALPAAAAVELFHTWTLVHDDIIDNDHLRRGMDTVHKTAEKYARDVLGLKGSVAEKYGTDTAILTGDVQHGWAISLLANNLVKNNIKPEVALHLITILQTDILRTLVDGEVLDVDYGLYYNIEDLSDGQVIDMLWKKTGILYKFCGIAGAMIGKNSVEYDDEVNALQEFCSLCGTAFQVRDDILGLIGDEKELGKPVGSDIREGKKTLLVMEALRNANEEQRGIIYKALGKSNASFAEIILATDVIKNLGGVEKAHNIAKGFVEKALPYLDIIKPSYSRDLLFDWANYMIERNY